MNIALGSICQKMLQNCPMVRICLCNKFALSLMELEVYSGPVIVWGNSSLCTIFDTSNVGKAVTWLDDDWKMQSEIRGMLKKDYYWQDAVGIMISCGLQYMKHLCVRRHLKPLEKSWKFSTKITKWQYNTSPRRELFFMDDCLNFATWKSWLSSYPWSSLCGLSVEMITMVERYKSIGLKKASFCTILKADFFASWTFWNTQFQVNIIVNTRV